MTDSEPARSTRLKMETTVALSGPSVILLSSTSRKMVWLRLERMFILAGMRDKQMHVAEVKG